MSTLVRAGMTPAERCRYVADLIEAHPENFDMGAWFTDGTQGGTVRMYDALVEDGERPDMTKCGTTCCIAGWAVSVTPPDEIVVPTAQVWMEREAGALLGLSPQSADILFWDSSLGAPDAAFLLRWHADELDRA